MLSVDGPLSINAQSDIFGKMERLWHEGSAQNFLTIDASRQAIDLHLHVYNPSAGSSPDKDRTLTIRPNQGYTLA